MKNWFPWCARGRAFLHLDLGFVFFFDFTDLPLSSPGEISEESETGNTDAVFSQNWAWSGDGDSE